MSYTNTFSAVIDFLLKPVPFLPAHSFVPSLKEDPEIAAKRRSARKSKAISRSLKSDANCHSLKGLIAKGTNSAYSVEGVDVKIDEDTWIFGELRVGASASVIGVKRGKSLHAKKIVIS